MSSGWGSRFATGANTTPRGSGNPNSNWRASAPARGASGGGSAAWSASDGESPFWPAVLGPAPKSTAEWDQFAAFYKQHWGPQAPMPFAAWQHKSLQITAARSVDEWRAGGGSGGVSAGGARTRSGASAAANQPSTESELVRQLRKLLLERSAPAAPGVPAGASASAAAAASASPAAAASAASFVTVAQLQEAVAAALRASSAAASPRSYATAAAPSSASPAAPGPSASPSSDGVGPSTPAPSAPPGRPSKRRPGVPEHHTSPVRVDFGNDALLASVAVAVTEVAAKADAPKADSLTHLQDQLSQRLAALLPTMDNIDVLWGQLGITDQRPRGMPGRAPALQRLAAVLVEKYMH